MVISSTFMFHSTRIILTAAGTYGFWFLNHFKTKHICTSSFVHTFTHPFTPNMLLKVRALAIYRIRRQYSCYWDMGVNVERLRWWVNVKFPHTFTLHRFSYFAYLVTSCLWACPQGKYLFGQTIYVGYVTVTLHYIRYYSVHAMRCDIGIVVE